MEKSGFEAKLFNVSFTPDTNTLHISINGDSNINGNVTATLVVIAYGYNALTKELNPCLLGDDFKGMCPMQEGLIQLESHIPIEPKAASQIPRMSPNPFAYFKQETISDALIPR